MNPIHVRLRELRDARGWTQDELAEKAGVTRATVSRIEGGKVASLDLEVFEKLADALDVHPAVLIDQKELPRQPYKDFVIVVKTRRRTKSGRWTLDIQIERHTGPNMHVKPYNAADTFDTMEAAVEGCIVFGRHVIDGRVPGLSPP